jgi:NAD(P)-dependent dehydrogenase (short-subunit alcohol dehydrogenase family)
MRHLEGRTAFVTGGAGGIGFALARAFLQAGMKVMIADIDEAALEHALRELLPLGDASAMLCDVSDRSSLHEAAQKTLATFGKVHVVCNNAGVSSGGLQEQIPAEDWDWVLGVNLAGVVNGVTVFLPYIKAHGEGGHIVNTASMAGMVSVAHMGPYCASKFAVVALSEGLAAELAGSNTGVTALCPGWVRTRIAESGRNRPARFGPGRDAEGTPTEAAQRIMELIRTGLDPDDVAARVLDAIRGNELYVFTHPEMRPAVEERFQRIRAAFDRAERIKGGGR